MRKKGNLSEELFKMRKLMNFNSEKFRDNVTSYDQLLESEIINNYLIKEQEEQNVATVKSAEILYPSDEEKKIWGQFATKWKPTLKTDESVGRQQEMSKQPNYLEFIQVLKDSTKSNFNIWYLQLDQKSREGFLTEFNTWVNSDKKIKKIFGSKKKDPKQYLTARLSKGSPTTEKIQTSEGKTISTPMQYEFQIYENDSFEDNKSQIPPVLQSDIDEFFKTVTPQINNAKQRGTEIKCIKIDVATSSSRFRNTGEAKDKTWRQLSEERAQNIYDELYNRLFELGVVFEGDHKIFRHGEHGDGTSGPNPGKNEEGKQYTISKDGSFNNIYKWPDDYKDGSLVKAKGNPHDSKEEYDQYKFAMVDVLLEGINQIDIDPEFKEVKYGNYYLNLEVKYELSAFRNLIAQINANKGLGKGGTPKTKMSKKKSRKKGINSCVRGES